MFNVFFAKKLCIIKKSVFNIKVVVKNLSWKYVLFYRNKYMFLNF